MHLREPFVRKHIHIFETSNSFWDSATYEIVERECKDCGKKQCARLIRDDWPEPIRHLADVEWKDGPLDDFERTC